MEPSSHAAASSDQPRNPAARAAIDRHLAENPQLSHRIHRHLLLLLLRMDALTVEQVYAEPVPPAADSAAGEQTAEQNARRIIREVAAARLTAPQIAEVVNLARKRDEAETLRAILNVSASSFKLIAERVKRFAALPADLRQIAPEESTLIRVGLIRNIVSDQLEFIDIARNHLTISDFDDIIRRTIGPEKGIGRIGGKAAGMLLAHKILTSPDVSTPESPAPPPAIAIPESFYLRADVIDEFLELNELGEYQYQKYKSPDEIRREYPLIQHDFRRGKFPAPIVDQLRRLLESIGNQPVIVRSSSLLEDRFGTAFSGKYASIFLPNQDALEARLKALLAAIAEIYASALGPDPLLYRRAHNLIDYQEDMGILIQKVVGKRIGDYFLPAFAGVAFSRNEYRWSPRLLREDGLVRMVVGMGTRAVDRIGNEYPRMVALSQPTLRPESTQREIIRNSQRTVDVINLAANRFESVPFDRLLADPAAFPILNQIVSIAREGGIYPTVGTWIDAPPRDLIITFDKLLRDTDFPALMRNILQRLETAYRRPVDLEFAHDGNQLFILQCRALTEPAQSAFRAAIPADVPEDRVVFSANRFVRPGLVENVEYVIYVPTDAYDALPSREQRVQVARGIGRLNDLLAEKNFILIGPGRWGSNDVKLGVPVTYADINHSKMLIEVARDRGGYVPEVSFGTHFFQDLIEADILYLPLYPDDPANQWNEHFFARSPNTLSKLLPRRVALADIIRVIHVPAVADGSTLRVVMASDPERALAYLVK